MLEPGNVLKPTVNLFHGVDLPAAHTPLALAQDMPLTGRHLGLSGPLQWELNLNKTRSNEMSPVNAPVSFDEGLREFSADLVLYEWTPENFDLLFQDASFLAMYTYHTKCGYIFLYRAAVTESVSSGFSKRTFTEIPLSLLACGIEDRPDGDQIGQIHFPNGKTRFL